jgi:hypothetical protein
MPVSLLVTILGVKQQLPGFFVMGVLEYRTENEKGAVYEKELL